jgi:hypothetical protein
MIATAVELILKAVKPRGGNEFIPPLLKSNDEKHSYYEKNCEVTRTSIQGCDFSVPECKEYFTASDGGCDFSKSAIVADGAEEKCKKCIAIYEKESKCRQQKQVFCDNLGTSLMKSK